MVSAMQLKLATLLDNPGEPPAASQYRDLRVLKELGFTGIVLYETTALSGISDVSAIGQTDLRQWVEKQIESVSKTIAEADEIGLDVYVSYDTIVLPVDVIRKRLGRYTCKGRKSAICPASELAMQQSVAGLRSMLERWPSVAGVSLRFGQTDGARLPYLFGNEIYSPHCERCRDLTKSQRIINTINAFHDCVVQEKDRRLIVRAWNVRPGGFHDNAELASRVIPNLPGDPEDDRLVLSFKVGQTDFWRYQPWNPSSLLAVKRPVIYECQCQPEFEGKGSIPNWRIPLWQTGFMEMGEASGGLTNVRKRSNFGGLWAWVRGGGWGGPFITDERWIDANVYSVPKMVDEEDIDPPSLARDWVDRRLKIEDERVAQVMVNVLMASSELARKVFYIGPYARSKDDRWHVNGDVVQDDLLDVERAWDIIQRLDKSVLDEVVTEKTEAVEQLAKLRAELQHVLDDRLYHDLEPMVNSMVYFESLAETLRDLFTGLVTYRHWRHARDHQVKSEELQALGQKIRACLFQAQSSWNHHTQRYGSMRGVATSFRDRGFWEVTTSILSKLEEAEQDVVSVS